MNQTWTAFLIKSILTSEMSNRALDWFRQAEKDLEQARDSERDGHYEWACFAAQQSAEKALKALHLHFGQEAWGHLVAKLLNEFPEGVNPPPDLTEKGKVLDNFYLPTRYANGHPSGAPFEHYGPLQSKQGIEYASEIIAFVRNKMAEH